MGSEAERIMAAEVLVAGSLRHPDDQMGAVAVEGQGQGSKGEGEGPPVVSAELLCAPRSAAAAAAGPANRLCFQLYLNTSEGQVPVLSRTRQLKLS